MDTKAGERRQKSLPARWPPGSPSGAHRAAPGPRAAAARGARGALRSPLCGARGSRGPGLIGLQPRREFKRKPAFHTPGGPQPRLRSRRRGGLGGSPGREGKGRGQMDAGPPAAGARRGGRVRVPLPLGVSSCGAAASAHRKCPAFHVPRGPQRCASPRARAAESVEVGLI